MRSHVTMLGLAGLLAGTIGCASDAGPPGGAADVPRTVTVSSADFEPGGALPRRFSCDGEGAVPSLSWSGVPDDAAAVALVVDDPDAPGGTYVHWVVLDLPAGTTSLDGGRLPPGAVQAMSSTGRPAYTPPCPPSGTHHYRFTVYALAEPTGLEDGADTDRALEAIASAATAQGRLTGTYARGG